MNLLYNISLLLLDFKIYKNVLKSIQNGYYVGTTRGDNEINKKEKYMADFANSINMLNTLTYGSVFNLTDMDDGFALNRL